VHARSVDDVGRLLRDRRRDLGMTQQELASRIAVGRRWVTLLENGHPRAELSLVLRALHAVGLIADVQVADQLPRSGRDRPASPEPVDLDDLLAGYDGTPE
jgi:HTH-type transcriptional regulator/antitoxin HipB